MNDPRDLEQLLEQIRGAAERHRQQITVEDVFEAVGSRSFAPLLMLVGVLIASPLSGIPLFPTVGAAIILAVCAQMLVGRDHFWLPHWLLERAIRGDRLERALDWLTPWARRVDRLIKPRFTLLVKGPSRYLIALTCLLIAATMPVMELIPFSSSAAGVTLCAFGLALVAYDGALALLAYLSTALTAALVLANLF